MNEVSVQTEDFDTGVETTRLRALSAHTGAIATFIGVVSESVGVVSEGIGAVSDSNENSRIVSSGHISNPVPCGRYAMGQ